MNMKKSGLMIALGLFILVTIVAGFFLFAQKTVSQVGEIKSATESNFEIFAVDNNKPLNNLPKNLASESGQVSLIAVGDVMLSRTVAKKIKDKKDINYPFLKINDYLSSADFVFANLENPITTGSIVQTDSMVFHADPGVEKALKNNNFSLVSLANNHTPNFGQKGLLDTFKYLKLADIKYVGAGVDEQEANQPEFIEKNGLKIAFLAFNDIDVVPVSYGASKTRAGTNLMNIEKMIKAVKLAKMQADLVIVSMHSGKEYTENITASQTNFAHAAILAGAELVIGHHPHVVQKIEKYKDKYIFYSLGNFIFDQMWSEDTRRGVAVKLFLNKNGLEKAEISSVLIENYSQPKILLGEGAEKVFKRLGVVNDNKIILIK